MTNDPRPKLNQAQYFCGIDWAFRPCHFEISFQGDLGKYTYIGTGEAVLHFHPMKETLALATRALLKGMQHAASST